ncbi:cytochrome P450 [Neobacillus mesonae]|nr:cytochrome P450 [Neobacillus mesonae]
MEQTSNNVQVAGWNQLPKQWLEAESPFTWFAEMRENSPVHFDEQRNTWDVFLYEDIKSVVMNYKAFSNQMVSLSILGMDPPKHKLYRSIVNKAFTPKIVEGMAPLIEKVSHELLDKAEKAGSMDFIQDFAYPLPVIVIAEMLGVPAADRDQFKFWSDELIRGLDVENGESPEAYHQSKAMIHQQMSEYFIGIVEEKQKNPGTDLVTALLNAKIEGNSLLLSEILEFCLLLLVAGNETTTNLLGNAMICFTEQQQVQNNLRSDVSQLPSAIEEVLRYRSPIQSLVRLCKEKTELSGSVIQEGQQVVLWLGSANRDEHQFDRADQFIMDRKPNQHLAFGMGTHFCLGAPLSRLEAKIAYDIIFKRLTSITLDPGASPQFIKDPLVHGFKKIPILFTAK